MDYNFWTVLGTWLGAIATAAAVAYALFRDVLHQPRLSVSFSPEFDIRPQVRTVGLPDDAVSCWLRICVKNSNRRTVAKNCRAHLVSAIDLAFIPGMQAYLVREDVRQLQWMHDPPNTWNARDLLPGVRHWVDVVRFVAGHAPVLCAYPIVPLGAPGECIITVQESAENAQPVQLTLRLTWDHSFDSLRGKVVANRMMPARVTSSAAEAIASPAWRDHRVGAKPPAKPFEPSA